MTQSSFDFERPIAIDTRDAAAAAIAPMVRSMLCQVFDFVAGRGNYGATDEEIRTGLTMLGDTARARRRELVQRGCIQASELNRPSSAGNPMTVWVITGQRLETSDHERPANAICESGR